MKLTILLTHVLLLIIVIRFTHVEVFNFNWLFPTFVHYSILEIYANAFIHVTLDKLSGGFRLLRYSLQITMNILLHVFALLLALEPFSPLSRFYTSMFNQFRIDLAISLREILFSSFRHS